MKFSVLFTFFTTDLIAYTGICASIVTSPCQPFSGYFIWHTGNGEDDSLIQYRRILLTLISNFPDNASISIETFGGENNIRFNFTKQAVHINWTVDILNYTPGNAFNNTISYDEILRAISKHSRSSIQAEIVYILVNGKTEIYNSRNDFEELRKKKTFVLLSGKQTTNKTNYWLRLSTTKRHFIESYKEEDINKTVETILDLSCQDSMFVCDTDMSWSSEKGCTTCTYICCSSCTKQPTFCTRACPYFHLIKSDKDIRDSYNDNKGYLCRHFGLVIFINCGLILTTLVVGVLVFKQRRRRKRLLSFINSLRKSITSSGHHIPLFSKVEANYSHGDKVIQDLAKQ